MRVATQELHACSYFSNPHASRHARKGDADIGGGKAIKPILGAVLPARLIMHRCTSIRRSKAWFIFAYVILNFTLATPPMQRMIQKTLEKSKAETGEKGGGRDDYGYLPPPKAKKVPAQKGNKSAKGNIH